MMAEQLLLSADVTHCTAFSTPEIIANAASWIAAADPGLAPLVEEFGPPDRLLAKNTPCFRSLAKSILYQQLAGTAAAAIYSRFLAVCGVPDESQLTPAAVLAAAPAALRGCGLSERKASYLQDLAAHFQDGRLSDQLLTSLPDAELLSTLTTVKGIGPWTVDMFAMFHLGRPDVLPTGDLGVRKGLAHLFGLSHLPSPSEMEQLTQHWRPYRSLGCYYMWRIPLPKRTAAKAKAGKAATRPGGVNAKRVKHAAVLASPLGAAVAAVADVGINIAAPMLAAEPATAAASAVTSTTAVTSAWGCREEQQQYEDWKQQQLPITPPKPVAVNTGDDCTCGSSGAAAEAPAAVRDNSKPAAASGSGVMTRRRLRWAATGAASQQSSTANAGLAGRIGDGKPRSADL